MYPIHWGLSLIIIVYNIFLYGKLGDLGDSLGPRCVLDPWKECAMAAFSKSQKCARLLLTFSEVYLFVYTTFVCVYNIQYIYIYRYMYTCTKHIVLMCDIVCRMYNPVDLHVICTNVLQKRHKHILCIYIHIQIYMLHMYIYTYIFDII